MTRHDSPPPATDGAGTTAAPRRPAVFAVAFLALFTLLLVRNRALFSVAVDEIGDSAANSIITYQAKHFTLLVGNYSRLGFSHPGPAFFYVQAFGEWFCYDLLGIVPSPWNGQVLAVLALDSALVAATLTLLAAWCRSWVGVSLSGAVLLGYLATYGGMVSAVWMPYMYVPPFLLLLTAAASVAAGRVGDLWALGLAGGLLVHGHAEYGASQRAGRHSVRDAFAYALRFWPGGARIPAVAALVAVTLFAAALVAAVPLLSRGPSPRTGGWRLRRWRSCCSPGTPPHRCC